MTDRLAGLIKQECQVLKFNGKHVLIAEGRARQSLPLIRAFKKMGCEVTALCASKLDVAYASRLTDHKVLGICDNRQPEETYRQIMTMIEKEEYDLVVPTTDFIAGLLSAHKDEFPLRTHVAVNDPDVFRLAGDKLLTMRACMENGIPCPATVSDARSAEDVIDSGISFPVVMKPRIGYGAIGFKKINSADELKKLAAETEEPFDHYVFQEYIPQTDLQYECAMFVDQNNEVKTSLVFSKNRWFPVTGGSSTLNITVERPDIVESCSKLLKAIRWRGAADIDLIQDPRDNTAKIMEINPRVSGSVRICFDAGADQARQMLELAFGEPVTEYRTYETGRRLRCSQTDLLWFIKSPDRFRCKPSWFSCRKTRDQIFYADDPWPWVTFSLHGLLSFRTEMKKRN